MGMQVNILRKRSCSAAAAVWWGWRRGRTCRRSPATASGTHCRCRQGERLCWSDSSRREASWKVRGPLRPPASPRASRTPCRRSSPEGRGTVEMRPAGCRACLELTGSGFVKSTEAPPCPPHSAAGSFCIFGSLGRR